MRMRCASSAENGEERKGSASFYLIFAENDMHLKLLVQALTVTGTPVTVTPVTVTLVTVTPVTVTLVTVTKFRAIRLQ